MTEEKLTVPQLLALIDLSEAPSPFASHWRPIQILVRRGYAVEKKGLFHITEAGRAAITHEKSSSLQRGS